MNQHLKLSLVILAAVLMFGASNASAQSKPDSLAFLKAQADTISAVLARAILQQDSTRIVSVIADTAGIVMPGKKALSGRDNIARYIRLLFQSWGGARLETTRSAIEKVQGYAGIARQAGTLTLTPADSTKTSAKWYGQYTVYWRFTDTTWIIERLFVSNR